MELHIGLNSPVPPVLVEQRVPEEEARVEPAHIAVRQATTVNDVVLLHLLARRGRLLLVDPVRLDPVLARDEAEFSGAANDVGEPAVPRVSVGKWTRVRSDAPLELLGEGLVIEEDVRVLVLAVEAVLDVAHALYRAVQIRVAREDDERRARAVVVGGRVVRAGDCGSVVVLLGHDHLVGWPAAQTGREAVDRRGISVCFVRRGKNVVEGNLRGTGSAGRGGGESGTRTRMVRARIT